MNRVMLTACGVLLCYLIAGCKTEPAELKPEANPYLSQSRVQYESHLTDKIVSVVRTDSERIGSGLLKVTLTLRNRTKSNLWVDIRTTFLDANNHVLEQTNWEPILLDSRTVSEYTCTSLSNKAADYQIIMRKPGKTSMDMR